MKGSGSRPVSPRCGLGKGHGRSRGGSPAGAVLCAQHLGIHPVPASPWTSGQGDRTQEDLILRGPFSCGFSRRLGPKGVS